jgi:hypothetical protein
LREHAQFGLAQGGAGGGGPAKEKRNASGKAAIFGMLNGLTALPSTTKQKQKISLQSKNPRRQHQACTLS